MFLKRLILNKYKDFIVGILSVIILFLLFAFYENKNKVESFYMKEQYNYYHVNVSSLEGIVVGDPVRLSGVEVGKVVKISLLPNYIPSLVVAIDKNLEIPDDTSVSINSLSLLSNQKTINLILGINTDILLNGDSIYYSTSAISFNELVETASKIIRNDKK